MNNIRGNRAGRYRNVLHGEMAYQAFVPNDLPPTPPIRINEKMQMLLSNADRALGGLNVVTELLPDSNFFIFSYLRKEATLSSKIEGTQATFMDVAKAEAGAIDDEKRNEPIEIINHIKAINYGLKRINKDDFPFALRLMKEIHNHLLKGVRGQSKTPGEFRKTQNWFGGATINTATYIPPVAEDMNRSLGNLEKYIHDKSPIPLLIKIALIHSQFETIHPFLDGNGKIGRLLITLLLCHYGALCNPSLYLSEFFHIYRKEYYQRLDAVHEKGDFEPWINFFLEGVWLVAEEAAKTAQKINTLKEKDIKKISHLSAQSSKNAVQLLEHLFRNPVISVNDVANIIKLSFANANNLVKKMVEIKILEPIDDRQRFRIFGYTKYLQLFEERETYERL